MSGTLDTWLGHYYRATLGGGTMEAAVNGFRQAIEANQDLRAEAEARRDSFSKDILKRCHISSVYKAALDTVLTPEG